MDLGAEIFRVDPERQDLFSINSMVLAVWLIFLVQGFFYAAFMPAWEGFDEPYHLGYVDLISRTGRLPVFGASRLALEIQHSFYSLPNPRWLWPNSGKVYGDPEIPDVGPVDPNVQPLPLYEAHQPPLYYLLMWAPYRLLESQSVLCRLFSVRFCSVLLASFFVFPAVRLIRELIPSRIAQVLTLFAIVTFPSLYIDIARVGNDSLGVFVYTLLCYRVVLLSKNSSTRNSIWTGAVLGLGLLTKMYFMAAFVSILILGCIKFSQTRGDRLRILKEYSLAILIALAIASPWFIRNYHFWGRPLLTSEIVGLSHISTKAWIHQAIRMPWLPQFDVSFRSFIWVGGWNFLVLPKSVYDFFKIFFLIIILGGVMQFVRNTRSAMNSMRIPLLFVASFLFALMGFLVSVYMVGGLLGGCGWYVYALVVPITIIMVTGIGGISSNPGTTNRCALVVIVSLALTNTYGVFLRLIPFYTSYPSGTFSLTEKTRFLLSKPLQNLEIMSSRLAPYKPECFTPHFYFISSLLFLFAVVASAVMPLIQTSKESKASVKRRF
jgi:4-amino-4-deoxy-L-arabinose transferase-like glycosyltransferase